MVSGGLRYDFTRFFSASLGGGFGFVDQELNMSIMGLPVEDKGFMSTYHFFTGLELRPLSISSLDFDTGGQGWGRWNTSHPVRYTSQNCLQAMYSDRSM